MPIKTKLSQRGLRQGLIVDIASMSQNARYKIIRIPITMTVVSGTTHNLGIIGIKGTVVAAYASNRTVGTYTTATMKLRNTTQAADITATLDPATVATGGASTAFTMATTPPTNALTDAIGLVPAGTWTGQPVELVLTVVVDPAEAADPINQ